MGNSPKQVAERVNRERWKFTMRPAKKGKFTFLERFEVFIEICYLKQSYAVSVCSLFSFLHAADFTSLHFTSFHFLFSLSLPTDRQLPQGTVNTTGVTLDLPRACPPPISFFFIHTLTYSFPHFTYFYPYPKRCFLTSTTTLLDLICLPT